MELNSGQKLQVSLNCRCHLSVCLSGSHKIYKTLAQKYIRISLALSLYRVMSVVLVVGFLPACSGKVLQFLLPDFCWQQSLLLAVSCLGGLRVCVCVCVCNTQRHWPNYTKRVFR